MKKDSVQLLQERAAHVETLENLVSLAKKEERELSPDEMEKRDAALKAITSLDKEIPQVQRTEEIIKESASRKAPAIVTDVNRGGEQGEIRSLLGKMSIRDAVSGMMQGGGGIKGANAEIAGEAISEAKRSGVAPTGFGIPQAWFDQYRAEQRNYDATTDNHGKHTVSTDVGGIIDALTPDAKVLQLGATQLTGLNGNVKFPRETVRPDVAPVAETGSSTATPTDPFGALELTPRRLTAHTDVSLQLLNQSSAVFDQWISTRLGQESDIKLDFYALNGDGSTAGHPDGLLSYAGVGEVFADGGDGTTGAVPSWSDFVAMETTVANANGLKGRLAYLTTPGLYGVGKTTTVDAGSGRFVIEGTMLNGYNVDRTTNMPSNLNLNTNSNQHATIFGNWADLMVGFWGGVFITVDDVTQITDGEVRFVLNRFYDVGPGQPGSFCKMRDSVLA